jgi:thymidylate synthase (FAD)
VKSLASTPIKNFDSPQYLVIISLKKLGLIMIVTLKQHTSLEVCASAIRTCWQSFDKSDNGGEKDKELIDRVGNKFKHASTLEHLFYTFYVQDISRALLQELARHRIASLSVKSTRYTLKELKNEESFTCKDIQRASKYLVMTGINMVDEMSIIALENLRLVLGTGISNDKAKYCLPESYKTELTWSVNARSLQNFLTLRSDKSALWEIQNLAHALYDALPQDHRYLFSIKDYE